MARIADLLTAGRTYSFEFFPPKSDAEHARLVESLMELQPLRPSFVSVTYRGGRSSRQRTHDLVVGMLRTTTLTPMAHLICVAHSRLELADILVDYRKAGVENLMALGGDPPEDPAEGTGELGYAIELVDLATDRDRLADKLRLADFAATQFFFEADQYAGLVEDLVQRGVQKPVLPG